MAKYKSCYLVCKEHINEVKIFLSQFFKEKKGRYGHAGWITFNYNSKFIINLMKGKDQPITQNITFEISCKSLKELEKFAKKFNRKINSFIATETVNKYRYHYIEIFGPRNICKLEINYLGNV